MQICKKPDELKKPLKVLTRPCMCMRAVVRGPCNPAALILINVQSTQGAIQGSASAHFVRAVHGSASSTSAPGLAHICAGTGQVHFVGEEAIDEGGVQKEFFQLIVRETFDPKFADPPAVPTNRSANVRGFALARGEAPPSGSDCAE